MHEIVITGGIAMGKSTVVASLRERFPKVVTFDADACVGELLTEATIRGKIAQEFGRSSLDDDGSVNRPFLRKLVFDSAERRAALEGILHPEVRKRFDVARDNARAAGDSLLFADIPLFFESGQRYPADTLLVVSASPDSQMERLLRRDGITAQIAEQMIAAQLPNETKIAEADALIWNSGSMRQLQTQLDFFERWLRRMTKRTQS